MNDHPTPAELEGFVWNRLPAGQARQIIAHLVVGCDPCRHQLTRLLCGSRRDQPPAASFSAHDDAAYDLILDRAYAATLRKAKEVREQWKREALDLLADPTLETLPEIPAHLQGLPFFEALLERSRSLRHESPEQMVRLAEWARFLSERLGEAPAAYCLPDLQCRAWIELGNAYRVADDLQEAERALGRATQLYLKGSGDELLAARLFDIQASLYGDCRRFDLAVTTLDLVLAIHRRYGNQHLAGRALIKKGTYVGYQGRAEEAIQIIEEGLRLLDDLLHPDLVFAGLHNQARLLVDCDHFREARKALFKLKARNLEGGGHINDLKVRWLEGQIDAGLGHLDRAETALREVQEGFAELDLGYKASLAGLELGAVLLRRGKIDAACQEVVPAADMFVALQIGREAVASVLILRKTFERQVADAALLDHVIRLLRGLESAPEKPEGPAEG